MRRYPLRNQKGQTSLFMALFIFTMIIMFAFTTNIGMLVHAKINLQNAADAAAYSGAAVQARQLTAAGYLNWEMRRALKALPCPKRWPQWAARLVPSFLASSETVMPCRSICLAKAAEMTFLRAVASTSS